MDVPDSALTRAASDLARRLSPPALVNHGVRSHWWAVALAELDGIRYDPELLYVAAALHDLGLEPDIDTGRSFEVDGGAAAAELVRHCGGSEKDAHTVEQAIVLHMVREISLTDGPESRLLWASTGTDVHGYRLEEIAGPWIDRVMAAAPWLDFPDLFAARIADQAVRKPQSRAAELWRDGLLERLTACALNDHAARL